MCKESEVKGNNSAVLEGGQFLTLMALVNKLCSLL